MDWILTMRCFVVTFLWNCVTKPKRYKHLINSQNFSVIFSIQPSKNTFWGTIWITIAVEVTSVEKNISFCVKNLFYHWNRNFMQESSKKESKYINTNIRAVCIVISRSTRRHKNECSPLPHWVLTIFGTVVPKMVVDSNFSDCFLSLAVDKILMMFE